MTRNHLLYWIFRYLWTHHPDILRTMLKECDGDTDHLWVNAALNERYEAAFAVGPS